MMRRYDVANHYARELGQEALERQQQEAKVRCAACWAPAGARHTETCPNRPPDETALPVEQTEALF